MIRRRSFIKRLAVTLAGISAVGMSTPAACKSSSAPVTDSTTGPGLRLIAYNIFKATGWPKDQKKAATACEKGQMPTRIAQELALYDPDIINFSESPAEPVVGEIARQLGMNYAVFPSGGNWPGTLLTRFKIMESANAPLAEGERPDDLFTRHWGKAVLELPGGQTVTVHSVHLYPHDTPEAGAVRQREIAEILKVASADLRNDRSVIIMGDLNHTPQMPEYKQWTNAGWVDTFAQAGTGNGWTIRADEPARRIDYVFAGGPLAGQITLSRPLFEGAFRTNPDDSSSFALSDHLPQYAEFNGKA